VEERRRLEQYGIRNVAQLQKLGASAGTTTVSRLSGIPVDRIRYALQQGRPAVKSISPEPPAGPRLVAPPRVAPRPPAELPLPRHPEPKLPPRPGLHDQPIFESPIPRTIMPDVARLGSVPTLPERPHLAQIDPGAAAGPPAAPVLLQPGAPILHIAPDTQRLRLNGKNLLGAEGPPVVKLNNKLLAVHDADDGEIVLQMPEHLESGALEIALPDGQQLTYNLSILPAYDTGYAAADPPLSLPADFGAGSPDGMDPWAPGGEEM
jgi:hypothetical protein